MKNCLVTKLKAVVDNPNLPILETMQQFTLNAIIASGNSSMTDAQRWALNHFFYQIGAVGNDGIFAKMKYIFIPMLANGVVANILVNYKDNVKFTVSTSVASNLQFSNNGVYTEYSSILQQELEECDLATTAISVAVASTVKVLSTDTSGYIRIARCGPGSNLASYAFNVGGTSNNYLVQGNGLKFAKADGYGAIANIVNGSASGLFIGESTNSPNIDVSGSNVDEVTPYTSRIWFGDRPVGIIMMGVNLSSNETALLADAIRELIVTYNN